MPVIQRSFTGDTATAVALTALTDPSGNTPVGVTLPAAFTNASGQWTFQFTGSAARYTYTYVVTWSDSTTTALDGNVAGDATGSTGYTGPVTGTMTLATPNVSVSFQQRSDPATGLPCAPPAITATADGSGLVTVTLKAGARYVYFVGGSGMGKIFVAPQAANTFDIGAATVRYDACPTG